MTELELYEKLKEAYETTTHSYNRFAETIEQIKWDDTFKADGEIYFVKEGFTLMVENLNPFQQKWKPSVFFKDGSFAEL